MPASASKRFDRGEELVLERDVERIKCLRPVEADDADAAAGFDDDGLGAHGAPWMVGSSDMLPWHTWNGKYV